MVLCGCMWELVRAGQARGVAERCWIRVLSSDLLCPRWLTTQTHPKPRRLTKGNPCLRCEQLR